MYYDLNAIYFIYMYKYINKVQIILHFSIIIIHN